MSPFGFGPPDDNNSGNSNNPDNSGDSGNFNFNEMMAKMQSEFQKISSNFPTTGVPGFINPAMFTSGPLPKDVIREVAKTFIQTQFF